MTVSVANTANTSTFLYWVTRTNELADAMSNKVVTVESNNAVGNAGINGTLFVYGLASNTVRGGNVTTTTVLTITSNVSISSGNTLTIGNSTVNTNLTEIQVKTGNTIVNTTQISIGSNVVINSSSILLGNSTVNTLITSSKSVLNGIDVIPRLSINIQTSGLSAQLVDSFDITSYRSAEYLFTIKDNTANSLLLSKSLVLYDGGDGLITEYGVITSNTLSSVGSFSSNANSTHCRVYFTPTGTNSQIKGYKSYIVV